MSPRPPQRASVQSGSFARSATSQTCRKPLAEACRTSSIALRSPVRLGSLIRQIRISPLYYVAELAMISALYVDRYVVAAYLGMTEAGAFVFVWSIANAIASLIQAGYIHVAAPGLIVAWNGGDIAGWHRSVVRLAKEVAAVSGFFAAMAIPGLLFVLPALGYGIGAAYPALAILVILAVVLRLISDTLHEAIYSSHRDAAWIALHILTLPVTALTCFIGITWLGLTGAGLASVAATLAILCGRYAVMRYIRSDPAEAGDVRR